MTNLPMKLENPTTVVKTVEESATPARGKLTYDEQMELCRYLAEFHNVAQAVIFVRQQFGKKLAYMSVKGYLESDKWLQIIDRFRNEYVTSFMEVPVANKRVRLERLEVLYQIAFRAGKVSTAREILSASRIEVGEGHEAGSQSDSLMYKKYSTMTNEEIEERLRVIREKKKELTLRLDSTTPRHGLHDQ